MAFLNQSFNKASLRWGGNRIVLADLAPSVVFQLPHLSALCFYHFALSSSTQEREQDAKDHEIVSASYPVQNPGHEGNPHEQNRWLKTKNRTDQWEHKWGVTNFLCIF